MGLSYSKGFVNSDAAFDNTYHPFEDMLHVLERDAFGADLWMRRAFMSHPGAGSEVLVETEGLGCLPQLVDERFMEEEVDDNLGFYTALDYVAGSVQMEAGLPRMLSARWRRIVRESYRVLVWHALNRELTPYNGPGTSREPVDLGGPAPTLKGIMAHEEEFARWVERSLAHDEELISSATGEWVRGLIKPLFLYGEVQAFASTIWRGQRWLRLASRVCELSAPEIPITETGFLQLPDNPEAGMVNMDTGEKDPRGFPFVRSTGHGVSTVGLQLPTLSGSSFEVVELDQVSDENPLRFKAKGDPFLELLGREESLDRIVLRHATENASEVFRAWLSLGPEILEEVPSYRIPEVDALKERHKR